MERVDQRVTEVTEVTKGKTDTTDATVPREHLVPLVPPELQAWLAIWGHRALQGPQDCKGQLELRDHPDSQECPA